MKLYLRGDCVDSLLARQKAELIVNAKEKVSSPAVDDMRNEAKKYIKEYDRVKQVKRSEYDGEK